MSLAGMWSRRLSTATTGGAVEWKLAHCGRHVSGSTAIPGGTAERRIADSGRHVCGSKATT